MTITRTGSTKKYAENWAKAFGAGTKKKASKSAKKKSKAAKKSTARSKRKQ